MFYLYSRVSTKEQNEDRQIIALKEFIAKESIEVFVMYTDKESGKNFDRRFYKRIIRCIKPGDVLVVKSIDRLGRNYNEILEQWRVITKKKECDIVVLDMPLLDTRKSKDLMGTFIADLVLQLLSYCSENERVTTLARQAEGIAAAKARGVKFGRVPIEKPAMYPQVLKAYRKGNISARVAGERLGVSHSTFLKWARAEA